MSLRLSQQAGLISLRKFCIFVIIAQCRVPRLPGDDVKSLAARVQVEEHIIYPQIIDAIAEGRVSLEDNKVTIDDVL